MNKLYTSVISLAIFLMVQGVKAQEKPFGSMIFRSQIFNPDHQAVVSQNIKVEAELFTKDKVWYSEAQQTNTNPEGFIFLQVGKGNRISGNFNEVPFSTQEISLRIRYKIINPDALSEGGFTELQATQLYAVPYAFHALTAGTVSGTGTGSIPDPSTGPVPGTEPDSNMASKGNTWSVYGNKYIAMRNGFLGTVDSAPLNFKTNNKLRMSIGADGKINFLGDVVLGSNNSLTVNNITTGSITTTDTHITNLSAQTGIIESDLQSVSPDTGALTVKGGTGIKKNLNIGENL